MEEIKKDPSRNMITSFWHCKSCSNKLPPETSLRYFARLECGWTPKGFQVRCVRCDLSVCAIDLLGQRVDLD